MLPVVEDEVEADGRIEDAQEPEHEENPADRVARPCAGHHIAHRAVDAERDEDESVVDWPRIVRQRGEGDANGQERHDDHGGGPAHRCMAHDHTRNLRAPAVRDRYAP